MQALYAFLASEYSLSLLSAESQDIEQRGLNAMFNIRYITVHRSLIETPISMKWCIAQQLKRGIEEYETLMSKW